MPDAPTPQEIEALLVRVPEGYTSGPWPLLNGDPIGVGGTDRNPIATIYPSNDADFEYGEGRCEREDRANSHLIALAPELATALRALAEERERLASENARLRRALDESEQLAERVHSRSGAMQMMQTAPEKPDEYHVGRATAAVEIADGIRSYRRAALAEPPHA